jgi:hypothetical protein
VSLAVGDYEHRHTFALGAGRPALDASGGEVLRVAHAYRNDVYHEDRHSERTLRTIVVATIHVVVRLWASALSAKYATSHGGKGPLMERLVEKGYEPPDWVGQMAKRGVALSRAKSQGALFARYRTLDMELRVFEETLADIAIAWDKHVEDEVDRIRGK